VRGLAWTGKQKCSRPGSPSVLMSRLASRGFGRLVVAARWVLWKCSNSTSLTCVGGVSGVIWGFCCVPLPQSYGGTARANDWVQAAGGGGHDRSRYGKFRHSSTYTSGPE